MTGEGAMADPSPGEPDAGSGFGRFDEGDMPLVQEGDRGAPAVLLIHGTAASTASWDPVVPALAGACRVIRVDLAGHGRAASPAGGHDTPPHPPPARALLAPPGPGPGAGARPLPGGRVPPPPPDQPPSTGHLPA